jgi:hypothetical protein
MKASCIDFKSYCAVLRAITVKQGKHNFKLGDWLNDGEDDFGKKVYTVAARVTGFPVSSLRRIAGVAKQVPRSVRNKKLSWGYHQLVQSLSPYEQRTLLGEAEVDSTLSVDGFRRKVGSRFPGKLKSKRKVPYRRFCFSIPEDQFLLLEKLAEAKGVALTDYIAQVVAQHVSSPWARAALIDAKATRDMRSQENRKKGRKRWENSTRRSIENLLDELYTSQSGSGCVDGADFVRTWRRRNGGRPFPLAFAQKHVSTFSDHYSGLTAEDLCTGKFTPVDEDEFGEEELEFLREEGLA